MLEQLLTTKLYIPPVRERRVLRLRLLQRLDEELSQGVRLTLDGHDNDLARFWSYVIAALQTVQAEVGQAAQTICVLRPMRQPRSSIASWAWNWSSRTWPRSRPAPKGGVE